MTQFGEAAGKLAQMLSYQVLWTGAAGKDIIATRWKLKNRVNKQSCSQYL